MLIEGLYTVTDFEFEGQELLAEIHLNKDHDIFNGHFPGNPVMPGVCMLQIIKELTERATSKNLFLAMSSNIKFMAIINPDTNPDLLLKISVVEDDEHIKIKNVSSFNETVALKLNATFKTIV